MRGMKRQQQSRIAELELNESWNYYRNELWYLIVLHGVQQRKVHNSWLQTWLGTVGEHLQHANCSWPYSPPRLAPALPCQASPSAAPARSPGAGSGICPVLRQICRPGQNRSAAVVGSRDRLPPVFLCGVCVVVSGVLFILREAALVWVLISLGF